MFAIASVVVDVFPNDKTDQLVCRLTMRSKSQPGSDLAQRSALNSVAGDMDR
jgi:hypothetical protein